jgi:D-alanyl-D-alanine carboxypeptidase
VAVAGGAKGATVNLVDATDDMTEAQAEGDAELEAEPVAVTQADVAKVVAAQPKNGWGIQVGAYNDRTSSQRALAIIADQNADLLRSAETRVLAVDTPNGTIYRARLVGLDEDVARRSCARLTKQNHPCLTLPPAGAPNAWLATAGSGAATE